MNQIMSAPFDGSSLAPKPTMTLDEALVEAHLGHRWRPSRR
jgi:hypothetical protein